MERRTRAWTDLLGRVKQARDEDYDEEDSIGWAWFTTKDRSAEVTWHNGGTGGYRAFLGFDREARTGIVVLADSANDVDAAIELVSPADSAEEVRR